MQVAELTTKFSFVGNLDIPKKVNKSLDSTVVSSNNVSTATRRMSNDINKTTSISDKLRGSLDRLKSSSNSLEKSNKRTSISFSNMFKGMLGGIGILATVTAGYNYFSNTLVKKAKEAEGADKEKYKNILALNEGVNKLKSKFSDFSFELLTKMTPILDKIIELFDKFSKSSNESFAKLKDNALKSIENVIDLFIKVVGWVENLDTKLNGYLIPTLAGLGVAWLAVSKIMKMSFMGKVMIALVALALVIEDVISYMNGGESVLGKLIDKFGKFGGILAYVTPLLIGLVIPFMKITKVTKAITKEIKLLGYALQFNPIGLYIAGIVALIAIIWDLYNGLTGGKSYIADFFNEWLKFDILGWLKDIWSNIVDVFTNIIDFLKNVFTGNWSEAFENLKNIVKGVFKHFVGIFLFPFKVLIGFVNTISEKLGFGKIGDKFKETFKAAITNVKDMLTKLFNWIPQSFNKAMNFVTDKISKVGDLFSGSKGIDTSKKTKIDTPKNLSNTNKNYSYQTNNDTKQNIYLNVNSSSEGNNALKGILGTQLSNA